MNRSVRIVGLGVGALVAWYVWARMTAGNEYARAGAGGVGVQEVGGDGLRPLRHFVPSEFGEWWPYMSTELLEKLDEFRDRLGHPVEISPAPGALGRHLGMGRLSQHNVDMWGEVRAADVMPVGVPLAESYRVAREVGFRGIGLYPDWRPRAGLHLDVRSGPLALWSGVLDDEGRQVYRGIEEAMS